MQLKERRVGEVAVLELAGKLTINDDLGRLKEKMASLLLKGHKHIVFNVGELTYVDSMGLGELIACHNLASRAGATVRLANAGRRLQDLLVLTKLLTVFDAYDSEEAAVDSFPVAV
jgi:anti-sigma B factor antagonist